RRRLGLLPAAPGRVRRPAGVRVVSRVAIDHDVWWAVGEPTRRRMLDLLLVDGGGTATTLSDRLPVTRQAVAKRLGVLDRVRLGHAPRRPRPARAGPRLARGARTSLRGRRGPARACGRPAGVGGRDVGRPPQ